MGEIEEYVSEKLAFTPNDDLRKLIKPISKILGLVLSIPLGADLSSIADITIDKILPSDQLKRVEDLLKELFHRLSQLEIKVDEQYLNSIQFEYILENAIRGTLNNYQETKIACYKGILINTIRLSKSQQEKEHFLNLVDRLSESHLTILTLLWKPRNFVEIRNISLSEALSKRPSDLLSQEEGISNFMLDTICHDLHSLGLVNTPPESLTSILKAIHGFRNLTGRLNQSTEEFIKFCIYFDDSPDSKI